MSQDTVRESSDGRWGIDRTALCGGYAPYRFDTPDGSEVSGRGINDDDWIDRTIGHFNEPHCGNCKQALEPVEKRYLGYWIWKLACPVCERNLYVTPQDDTEESVESVTAEYVESSCMSEAGLEQSLETVL